MTAPGDPFIARCALLLTAAARGSCALSGFPLTPDTRRALKACRALGVAVEVFPAEGPHSAIVRVSGGNFNFSRPAGGMIDCGDSAGMFLLLTGLLAGQSFDTTLRVEASAAHPAFPALVETLEEAGARLSVETSGDSVFATVKGDPALRPSRVNLSPERAPLKTPLLFAAARASGVSVFTENPRTPDHVENLLRHFGGMVERSPCADGGSTLHVTGGSSLHAPGGLDLPGSLLCAAPWMAAAAARPGSELIVRDVGLNVTRCGVIRVLLRMGARVTEEVESVDGGEPSGTLTLRGGDYLRGTLIDTTEFPAVADVLPALALAAAVARGKTVILAPPGAVTSDFTGLIAILRAFGVPVRELAPSGLEITGSGGARLRAARLESPHGAMLAMTAAVAGLLADGLTLVKNAQSLRELDPGFPARLRAVQNPSPQYALCS